MHLSRSRANPQPGLHRELYPGCSGTSTDAWARTPQLRLRERRILADVGESEVVRVPGNLSHLGMHDGEYASRKA